MVRAASYVPFVRWLASEGLDTDRRLSRVGISSENLYAPDRILPEKPLWDLAHRMRTHDGISDVGFRIGAGHRLSEIDLFATTVCEQPTLLLAVEAFCIEGRRQANYWDLWVEDAGDSVILRRKGSPLDAGREVIEQYVLSYLTDLVRMAVPGWRPDEIWLQRTGALARDEERWLNGARAHLASPVTAIRVPASLLAKHPLSSRRLSPASSSLPLDLEFLPALRQLIASFITETRPSLETIAAACDLHPRGLQRRLAECGTSFRTLLEEGLIDCARECLEATDVRITDLAYELGYAHLSSFSRSFRRSTGVSPQAYRSANRQN